MYLSDISQFRHFHFAIWQFLIFNFAVFICVFKGENFLVYSFNKYSL